MKSGDVPLSAISRYSIYLKKLYIRAKYPIKCKWPPSPCKKVINLAAVEKCGKQMLSKEVFHSKSKSLDQIIQDTEVTPIELSDLLKTSDGSQPRCVIVQGAPGIGKSTFAWKACRKWGKSKLFQGYDLVVLLRMRESYVRDAKILSDLFHSSDQKLSKDVTQEVIDKSGEGVLFIFEGIDELPSSVLNDDNSVLMELLQGLLLPDVTIVATCRPWAVQFLLEKCGEQISRHIEILGFTADDITRYISHSFSKEEQDEFQQYILSQPHLLNIMYIPLNTAITVHIYQQRKRSNQPLPKTTTQLYTSLVQSLILRHLKSIPQYRNVKLDNLSSLPEPISQQFHQLCELAYSGFTKKSTQVIFNESDLPTGVDSLELMQSTSEFQADTGSSVSHAFLHITIQEFLAAYYISLQGVEFASAFVYEHLKSPMFSVLFRFLAGLSCIGISLWRVILPSLYDADCISIQSPEYLHWLYEAQSPELCKNVLNARKVDYVPMHFSLSDINALSYCLQHSASLWTLNLSLSSPTCLFHSANAQHSIRSETTTEAAARIQGLVIYSYEGNSNTVSTFLQSIPTHCFLGIHTISINGGRSSLAKPAVKFDFQVSTSNSLTENTRLFQALTILQLANVILGDGGAVSILKSLQSSKSSISSISLIRTRIGCSDMIELCKIISTSTTLNYLNIADNSLSSESLQHLFSALMSSTVSLKILNISSNAVTSSDAEFLSIALSINQSLTRLYLDQCSIDAEGVLHLASGLTQNIKLAYLHMTCNHIGVNGACSLADLLQENTTLEMLLLHYDPSIQTTGAEILISSLETNHVLRYLSLDKQCEPPQLQLTTWNFDQKLVGKRSVDINRIEFIS